MATSDRKATRIGSQRLSRRMGGSDPRNHRRENRRQIDGDLDQTLRVDKAGRVGIVLGKGLMADRNGVRIETGAGLKVSDQGSLEVVPEKVGKGLMRGSNGLVKLRPEKFTDEVADSTTGTAGTSLVDATTTGLINNNFATLLAHVESLRRAIERQGALERS